jgi:uncharacterized damage-inducible protein DinB
VSGSDAAFITPDAFLRHWQGHRRLTRRVIDAFPDDGLFTFALGGMRPFGGMALELLAVAGPMLRGILDDVWDWSPGPDTLPKAELLDRWDEATTYLDANWSRIAPERFSEVVTVFGQWEGPVYQHFLYCVDNEIHHRGQGYVYLRALGIEPPPFYERD